MEAGSDARPPFVDRNSFVPKGPHKSKFLAGVDQVPNLRPIKLVIPQKIPLPFLHHSSHAWGIIDNKVPSKLSGIIKETIRFNPTPTIRVPDKADNFSIQKGDFLFPLTSSSVNDFHCMEEPSELSGQHG